MQLFKFLKSNLKKIEQLSRLKLWQMLTRENRIISKRQLSTCAYNVRTGAAEIKYSSLHLLYLAFEKVADFHGTFTIYIHT